VPWHQAVFGHAPRQRHDGGLALFDDAQFAERIAAGLRQHGGRRKQPGEFRKRCVNGLAEPVHQPLRERARGGHRDLLAEHGAHRELEAVERAGHAQAVASRKRVVQHRVDRDRVGVQVERGAQAVDHLRQHLAQLVAHAQHELATRLIELGQQPAAVAALADVHAQGLPEAQLVVDEGHTFDQALPKESQRGRHVVGRPVAQAHRRALAAFALAGLAPQLGRVQAVVVEKGGVEAPHAGKAAGERDLGDGQIGVGEQLFGREQLSREQVLQRRDAEPVFKHAAQVAVAHAQARGQAFAHVAFCIAPVLRVVEPERGLLQQDGGGVFSGPVAVHGCQLGAAAQAGPKPRVFRLRRVLEEAAVLAPRCAHAADRAAVDAGGRDGREELPVKARVVRAQRAVAGVVVDAVWAVHGCDGRPFGWVWLAVSGHVPLKA